MFKNKLISRNAFILVALMLAGLLFLLNSSREPYSAEIRKCKSEKSNVCWVDLIKTVFEKDGLSKSLEMVETVYKIDSGFSADCHDIGHYLGKETYLLFKNGEDFDISSKAAFCSYGFYHGFMEAMISSGTEISKVRDFCDYVDIRISQETPDATYQCFHGIGHGWVNVHDRKDLWGDDVAIAGYGLSLCEKVSKSEGELSRCATGVFNGISFFYLDGEYQLKPNLEDPLWLCKAQPDKYKDPCFISMNSFLLSVSEGDFLKAVSYVASIPDREIAKSATLNLSLAMGAKYLESDDHSDRITLCRSLNKDLVIPCLQGYSFAFLEHGEPGEEYKRAIGFCKNNNLTTDEENGCLSYIYSYLAQWYNDKKAFQICNNEGENAEFCRSRVEEGIKGLKQ